MKVVVVGAGAWGTAFAGVLREREHDVFLAGRATLDDAPYDEADLVVLAVTSRGCTTTSAFSCSALALTSFERREQWRERLSKN